MGMRDGANGYRLPTEAEWEYACRAGTETAHNTGSNTIDDNTGWYKDSKIAGSDIDRTQEVGQKPPNRWGLYDMHGNVLEWCWDWYASYSNSHQTGLYGINVSSDPAGPTIGSGGGGRVFRGGSWHGIGHQGLRSANRSASGPFNRLNYGGFRVVRP
jgi:formylglycine-generating enzyme required for sulfatase activity